MQSLLSTYLSAVGLHRSSERPQVLAGRLAGPPSVVGVRLRKSQPLAPASPRALPW